MWQLDEIRRKLFLDAVWCIYVLKVLQQVTIHWEAICWGKKPGGCFSKDPVTYQARKAILEIMIHLPWKSAVLMYFRCKERQINCQVSKFEIGNAKGFMLPQKFWDVREMSLRVWQKKPTKFCLVQFHCKKENNECTRAEKKKLQNLTHLVSNFLNFDECLHSSQFFLFFFCFLALPEQ